jgi:hypothetical protein
MSGNTFSQSDWTSMGAPFAYDRSQQEPSISCVSSTFCMSVGAVGDKDEPSGTVPADVWNGSTWTQTSLPVPMAGNPPTAAQPSSVSCSSTTFCLATGAIPPQQGMFVDRWDGSKWSAFQGPVTKPGGSGQVDCLSSDACIVVGSNDGTPLAVEWNGTSWSTMPNTPGDVGTFASVSCADASACMAVGWTLNGTLASERWDGSEWSDVAIPNEATGTEAEFLTSVSCPAPTSCVAVGWHSFQVTPTSGGEAPIVDSWDGTAWSQVPLSIALVPELNDNLYGVDCWAPGQCIAVGGPQTGWTSVPSFVMSSDNGSWSVTGDPPVGPNGTENVLSSISCVAGWSCVTGGQVFTTAGTDVFYDDASDTGPSAPIADITSPVDGQVFATASSATATFSCSPGLDDPGLTSCVDSNGSAGPDTLDTSTPGNYTFSVTATSQDGESGTATVHYLVAGMPSITLSPSISGETYGLNQVIPTSFACAEGADGPGILLCVQVGPRSEQGALNTSSPGLIVYGQGSLDTSSPGPHTYQVGVLSQDGLYSVTTVGYTVADAAAPSAIITAPAPPSPEKSGTGGSPTLYQLNQVVPTAFACNEETGGPGIASCIDSNGSTSPGQLDTSKPGLHTYTVTATSQDGVVTTSSFAYTVVGPPTAQIVLPTAGQTFQIGQAVGTHFSCTDDMAGPGIATCVDVNGSSSPGSLNTATLGGHTYSITATSKDGQSDTVSVTYTVVPSNSGSTTTTTTPTNVTTTTITSTTTTTTTRG